MTTNSVNVALEANVATVTIDRPKQLNALNRQVLDELSMTLERLEQDAEVRVILLTGAGEKAFVAGADIKEMAGFGPRDAAAFATRGQDILHLIAAMDKPVIAAVNGYALGGGFELALACDFIYAADTARFAFPETGLGIMPGFGGTQKLARLTGPNIARELIFSGEMIDAERAAALGIVNRVVPAAELLATAGQTAAKIAAKGGVGIALAKEAIGRGSDMPLAEALAFEGSLFAQLFATADQREGMTAFIDKRAAQFNHQ